MPTPMPIIEANAGVNAGRSKNEAATPTRRKPDANASSAVRIGRPIATTEPNATSKMITAAPKPMSSALPGGSCSAERTTRPPASTCKAAGGVIVSNVVERIDARPLQIGRLLHILDRDLADQPIGRD